MSGKADEAKGRIKEAVGDLTGDKDLKRDGKMDQAAGKIKDKIGDAKEKIEDSIDDLRNKDSRN